MNTETVTAIKECQKQANFFCFGKLQEKRGMIEDERVLLAKLWKLCQMKHFGEVKDILITELEGLNNRLKKIDIELEKKEIKDERE